MSCDITHQRYVYEKSIRTVSDKIHYLINGKVFPLIYHGVSAKVRDQVWNQVETRIGELTRDVRNLIERKFIDAI